jgi:hypothetical protein
MLLRGAAEDRIGMASLRRLVRRVPAEGAFGEGAGRMGYPELVWFAQVASLMGSSSMG